MIDSMEANHNYPIKDSRDTGTNATARYTIAKLTGTENNGYSEVWMTTNLDLAGGTQLTHADTDIPEDYTITASGFTDNKLPASSTTGFDNDTKAFVFNSGRTSPCTGSDPGDGCYSYYSWLTATAGGKNADGSAVAGYHNAPYSICPAGWRLPTATTNDADPQIHFNWRTGDFYKLATAYGANLEKNQSASTTAFYDNAGSGTIPNFLLGGDYHPSSFRDGGSWGNYWSATSRAINYAYNLYFSSSRVYTAGSDIRRYGFSVRCILR